MGLVKSSYDPSEVTILLKDITGLVKPMGTKEREKLIQSGVHYSEMLPLEYKPTEDYMKIYEEELERIENNCCPILSMIHNYYSTTTTEEEMYIVNGDLKKISDFKHKIDRFLANGKISTNDIIEDTFLKEIENGLKKSKQKLKKGKERKK